METQNHTMETSTSLTAAIEARQKLAGDFQAMLILTLVESDVKTTKSSWFAKKLGISLEEATSTIEWLLDHGFIRMSEKGYLPSSTNVDISKTSSDESLTFSRTLSIAMRSLIVWLITTLATTQV